MKQFHLVTFILFTQTVLAQNISISPNVAGGYGFGRGKNSENFNCCNPHTSFAMGASTEINWENWGIGIEYNWNQPVWFSRWHIDNNQNTRYFRNNFEFTEMHQVLFNYSRDLSYPYQLLPIRSQSWIYRTLNSFRKHKKDYPATFALQFKFKWLAALGINITDHHQNESIYEISQILNSGLQVDQINTTNYNEYNFTLRAGFAIQFFQRDRDRLRLEFLYNQGLKDLVDINYQVNFLDGENQTIATYNASVHSRGAYLYVRASYPIVIKRWN